MNITITQEILNGKLQQAFNYGVNEGRIQGQQEFQRLETKKIFDAAYEQGRVWGQNNPTNEIITFYKKLGYDLGFSEGYADALKGSVLHE